MNKLEWHSWTTGNEIPEEVPVDEVLLMEVDGRREYAIGNFFFNTQGHKMGTVGDYFHWDRTVLRWASIQHLIT